MATRETAIAVDDGGQFDDAEQDFTAASEVQIQAWTVPAVPARSALESAPAFNAREGRRLIDEDEARALQDSASSSSLSSSDEEDDNDDGEAFFEDVQVDDEDWEISERDFTKQYNRLKQHLAVRNGAAQPSAASGGRVPLPAINLPSRAVQQQQQTPEALHKAKSRTQDQLQALAKYNGRLARIADPYGADAAGLGAAVNRKGPSASANQKDKSDRATNEQVLDPRTRLILFKMIGRGLVHEVNGCVSTGKEANVYHALTPEGAHLALKIFKTSILVFKDRDRYVSGEYRFRRGYSRHNPRKMVRVWAEKEMRNLKRLVAAGIRCPAPVEVRENVLVMDFLGDAAGWAAPRLKDAQLPPEDVDRLYGELLLAVRRLFHECRLVHADLSEYNILYHRAALWIIDVSQSVEHDHPAAFDFLRQDLTNVDAFFARAGARRTLGLRRAFDFVTRALDAAAAEEVLAALLEEAPRDDDQEDAVFRAAYIPRTLDQVFDPERDVEKLNRGARDELIYNSVIGVQPAITTTSNTPADAKPKKAGAAVHFADEPAQSDSGDDESASDSEGEGEGEGEGDDRDGEKENEDGEGKAFEERAPRGHRHEDRDAKKERKRATKEEARERRRNKMPKAEKKKKIKATKAGK